MDVDLRVIKYENTSQVENRKDVCDLSFGLWQSVRANRLTPSWKNFCWHPGLVLSVLGRKRVKMTV